ncbi:hypothetical protein FOA52_005237 [Chlamydomonas sp. UWO 241]|nr:hypothetical protein FOA52_005237 [Chlamydomonas sp. UWO 241]
MGAVGDENPLALTLQRAASGVQRHSISLGPWGGPSSSGPQPLLELGMAKDEVKARLAPIPVYTVANPKNEFVLVAGENNTQLGFFFFTKADAEAIVEKIREENPRLARDSKILKVTMDNVYEVFTTPRDVTGLQGIHFRFMPDVAQVKHALELYTEAGVPTKQFVGVPVFQAEGLTVTTQEMQYVPLFLAKEDLDIAVQSAYKQRNAAQIKLYRDKAIKFDEEYNQVAVQAGSAVGREKSSLEGRAGKAKQKADAAKEKADAVERAPMPKIEVGSFEEVMMRMTASNGDDLAAWSQVMFVAPGLLQQAVLKEAAAAAGGAGKNFVLSIPVARGANWLLAGGGRRMDEEEATAAAAERIAAAAEDGTSLPVRLATDVVRFLYGGTGRREPADGGVVSASLLNAKPAVGGIGVEPRGGGVLRVLFTVASDAVADTVVRWRHELRRCVDSNAVFDVLSDREEVQHQALWPAFLAAKVAGKRAQFHRARLVVDGERCTRRCSATAVGAPNASMSLGRGGTMEDGAYSDTDSVGHASTSGSKAKPLGPEKLLEVTERVYRAFNPAQVTLDTHADEQLGAIQLGSQFDDTFIRQVLYGVVRYRQFLGSLMDSFYYYNSGVANRDDRDMYKVMAYLTIFRLEELGFAQYRRLVDAKEPQKMVVFFRYLFNEGYLRGAVRDDWLKLYDKQFVDETIQKILSWSSEMSALLDSLEELVYLTRKKDDDKKDAAASALAGSGPRGMTTTIVEPFNLSEPRPKPLPVSDPPPPPIVCKPPPKMREGPTKEQIAIDAAREANKRAGEQKLANAAPFKLRILERPTNLDKIRDEIEADLMRELTFKPSAPRAAPPPPVAPVKLNTAAILREDAVYRKKQAQEADMLKKFESELHDAGEFKAWQSKMLKLDGAAREAEIERRRLEMAESAKAAVCARERTVEENLALGRQVKADTRAIEESLAAEREEARLEKARLRDAVLDTRGAAAVAAEKVVAEKRQLAEEERARSAANAKALAEQEIRELAEKRDIIMQLRALEKVPRVLVKEFDPTVAPDHGLLETMPLIELRERLVVSRRRVKEDEERTRMLILQGKQERQASLRDKAANIARVRKVAAAQGQQRRETRVVGAKASESDVAARHEDDVLNLHARLEAKRAGAAAETARIAAEEKKIKFEQMQQAAGAAAVEENKFRELRSGAQRELIDRQTNKLTTATATESIKRKATSVRMHNVKTDLKGKQSFLASYDEQVAALTRRAAQEARVDETRRQGLASSQRQTEAQERALREAATTKLFAGDTSTMQSKLAALATHD